MNRSKVLGERRSITLLRYHLCAMVSNVVFFFIINLWQLNLSYAGPNADPNADPKEQFVKFSSSNVEVKVNGVDQKMQKLLELGFVPNLKDSSKKVLFGDKNKREFYLSDKLICNEEEEGRCYTVIFSKLLEQHEGKDVFIPQMVYTSASELGAWRSPPAILFGRYVKGAHYTQSTQLANELSDALAKNFKDRDVVKKTANKDEIRTEIKNFESELGGMYALVKESGQCDDRASKTIGPYCEEGNPKGRCCFNEFDASGAKISLNEKYKTKEVVKIDFIELEKALDDEKCAYPKNFIPNFDQPKCKRERFLNGRKINILVFESEVPISENETRKVEWHVAQTSLEFDTDVRTKVQKNILWIDRISFTSNGDDVCYPSGSYQDTLDSGVLTAKPLEYKTQVPLEMEYEVEGELTKGRYRNMSPVIDLLRPIQRFKETKWNGMKDGAKGVGIEASQVPLCGVATTTTQDSPLCPLPGAPLDLSAQAKNVVDVLAKQTSTTLPTAPQVVFANNKGEANKLINEATVPMGSIVYWPSSSGDGSYGHMKKTKENSDWAQDAKRALNEQEMFRIVAPLLR